MPPKNKQKRGVTIKLDEIHFQMIQNLQPFYGNSQSEVIRYIVLNWLENKFTLHDLEKIKAIKKSDE